VTSAFPVDDPRLPSLRAGLPALGAGIFLDTPEAGPMPAEAAAAMSELAARELQTGRSPAADPAAAAQRADEARAAVAAVLTADLDEIAITASGSAALATAIGAMDWRPGDRAVTTALEHPATLGTLEAVRDRLGVDLGIVDVRPDVAGPDEGLLLADLAEAIGSRARLVVVSHVASTGAVLPVGQIADLAHERGALVVVDGAQATGAVPVDVGSLGVDAYAVPGHTWLLGPAGIGALWVGKGGLGPAARRLDAVDLYAPSVLGLARAIGWLSMYVGLPWAFERSAAMSAATAERLAAIPGVRVLTPRQAMATVVAFRIDGWTAEAALEELGARVFAIASVVPSLDAIRIGVDWFNDAAEMDRFLEAVVLLASHGPDALPPRRGLEIVARR
jgi:L-cysteine/cystine lyase